MTGAPDPLEVLAFIAGYSTMPAPDWRARWPDWAQRTDVACSRFRSETDTGRRRWAKSSAVVDSEHAAVYYWVFLPLIQAALEAQS